MPKIIHTFGDSHCYAGWKDLNIPNVIIKMHGLATDGKAPTCAGISFTHLYEFSITAPVYEVQEEEIVCFVLGEVDCRMHIHKHKDQYKDIIDRIIEKYFIMISNNVNQYKNLTTIVQTITPVGKKETYKNNHAPGYFDDWPILGEDGDRKIYTEYFNDKIKEYCKKYGYSCLNLYDKYCDEEGYLNLQFSDTEIHSKDPIYLEEELMKLI